MIRPGVDRDLDSEWRRKGATLSDKTARKEFGLTQDEIVAAIGAGNEPLYGAARREFGSWKRALRAVDPKLVNAWWKRGESIIAEASSAE